MARIEIPMEEYQGMKERIETLEKALVESQKKAEQYQTKYDTLVLDVEDLEELSLFERIFDFKSIIKRIIGHESGD